jgi:two-component sensor histidine kinase/HAMP domain-containing protein
MVVVITEFFVLLTTGVVYSSIFSASLDRDLEDQALITSHLISSGYLSIASIADAGILQELTENQLLDSMAFNDQGRIIAAYNGELRGKQLEDLPQELQGRMDFSAQEAQVFPAHGELISFSPIIRPGQSEPFLFLYISLSREVVDAQKIEVILLFLLGSILAVVITSILLFMAASRLVLRRIQDTLSYLDQVGTGNLTSRLPEPRNDDEISAIQRQINQTVSQLEKVIKNLEEEVGVRQHSEEQLAAALEDKTTLLQELYHRTKNNMQVIISLLNWQAQVTDNSEIHRILEETQNRIRSMSLVHKKLYESKNLSTINLRTYMEDLVASLLESYQMEGRDVEVEWSIEDVPLLLDSAIPCGLIVNELVTNSLKYAFQDQPKPLLSIEIRSEGENGIYLRLADNGKGFAPGFEWENSDSIGIKTVMALSQRQLEGEVSFEGSKGVEFILRFKDNLYKKRV